MKRPKRQNRKRSNSGTVSRALGDSARRIKARRILELAGSGAWEGDLAKMRGDRPPCRSSRRTGLTLRSGVDCLIAACAIRHGLTVLHRDRDFDRLARISSLQVREVD